jgi:hypothetical protein
MKGLDMIVVSIGDPTFTLPQKMRTPGNRPLRALMAIDAGGPQRESGRRAEENGEPLELEQVRPCVLLRRAYTKTYITAVWPWSVSSPLTHSACILLCTVP